MVDLFAFLSEVAPPASWGTITFFLTRAGVNLLRPLVFAGVEKRRLEHAIILEMANGASKKQVRRLIEADHKARSGRSP